MVWALGVAKLSAAAYAGTVLAKGEIMRATRMWMAAAIAISLVLVLSGVSTPARGAPAGNAVTEWNLIAVNTLAAMPGRRAEQGPPFRSTWG
jgi:hypothetical protein